MSEPFQQLPRHFPPGLEPGDIALPDRPFNEQEAESAPAGFTGFHDEQPSFGGEPEASSGTIYEVPLGTNYGKTTSFTEAAPGEAPAVDTGNLKNSILAQPIGDGSKEWEVRVAAEYGIALEFGTEDIAPRPFARPAMEKTAGKVEEAFQAEFDQL